MEVGLTFFGDFPGLDSFAFKPVPEVCNGYIE